MSARSGRNEPDNQCRLARRSPSHFSRFSVHPPFPVDATESIAPGRHAILWRLLSYRKPWRRWNPDPWRFEMLLRDEVRHTDIELRADETGNLVPMEQERS